MPKEIAEPAPMRVACLEGPVVVQIGEQLAASLQSERLLRESVRDESVDLARVDPQVLPILDPHPIPGGGHEGRRRRALATERRKRRAKAHARRLLEHVRPEQRRDLASGVQPPVQRQPGEKRPRPATRDALQRTPIELDAQLPKEPDAKHRRRRTEAL
jgi:hypothetical protein